MNHTTPFLEKEGIDFAKSIISGYFRCVLDVWISNAQVVEERLVKKPAKSISKLARGDPSYWRTRIRSKHAFC